MATGGFSSSKFQTLKSIFLENVGDDTEISVSRFGEIIESNREQLSSNTIKKLSEYIDKNKDGKVSLNEINKLEKEDAADVAAKTGVHVSKIAMFREGLDTAGGLILSKQQQEELYKHKYKCCPPPILMIILSIVQLAVYIYYGVRSGEWVNVSMDVIDSPLSFRPDKRQEAWRFLSYMLVHAGVEHVVFNILVQLILGIPLEMVHGGIRVVGVYMAGVLAGSLITSIVDFNTILVGGSGGVYALLTAQIANVILNGDIMPLFSKIIRILIISALLAIDFGYAAYRRFSTSTSGASVAFMAHIAGAVTGVVAGIVLLKNFRKNLRDTVLIVISVCLYIGFIIFAIFWNIFWPDYIPST